jgi:hypothetical protein
MIDLDTLIPPGSGLQLTNVFNVNPEDRRASVVRYK